MDKVIAKEIIGVMNDNTTIISELRRVIESQGKQFDSHSIKVALCGECLDRIETNLNDIADKLQTVDECSNLTETTVLEVKETLDNIDKYHRYKFPLMIGLITLIIYGIGFFFTLSKIDERIEEIHNISKAVQIQNKAIK